MVSSESYVENERRFTRFIRWEINNIMHLFMYDEFKNMILALFYDMMKTRDGSSDGVRRRCDA